MTEKIRIPEVQVQSPMTDVSGGMGGYTGGGSMDVYTQMQYGNVERMRAFENFIKATTEALYESDKAEVEQEQLNMYSEVMMGLTHLEDSKNPLKDNQYVRQTFTSAKSRKLGHDANQIALTQSQKIVKAALEEFDYLKPEASASKLKSALAKLDQEMIQTHGAEFFGNENYQKVYGQARSQIKALWLDASGKMMNREQSSIASGLMDEQLDQVLRSAGSLEPKDLKKILSMPEIKGIALTDPQKEGLLIAQLEDKVLETLNNPMAPPAVKEQAFLMSFVFEKKKFGRNGQSLEKLHPDLVEGAQSRIRNAYEAYKDSTEKGDKIKLNDDQREFHIMVQNAIREQGPDYDTMKEITELKDDSGRLFSTYFKPNGWRTFTDWASGIMAKTREEEGQQTLGKILTTNNKYGLYKIFPTHVGRLRFAQNHPEIYKEWQEKVTKLDDEKKIQDKEQNKKDRDDKVKELITQIRNENKTAIEVLDKETSEFLRLEDVQKVWSAYDSKVASLRAERAEERSEITFEQAQENYANEHGAGQVEMSIVQDIYSRKDEDKIFTFARLQALRKAGKGGLLVSLRERYIKNEERIQKAQEALIAKNEENQKKVRESLKRISDEAEKQAAEQKAIRDDKGFKRMTQKVFSGQFTEEQLFGDNAIMTIDGKTYPVQELLTGEQFKAFRTEFRKQRKERDAEFESIMKKASEDEKERNAEIIRLHKFRIYDLARTQGLPKNEIFSAETRADWIIRGGSSEDWQKAIKFHEDYNQAIKDKDEKKLEKLQKKLDDFAETQLQKDQSRLWRESAKKIKKGNVSINDIFTAEVEEKLTDTQWTSLFDRLSAKQKAELAARDEEQTKRGIYTYKNLINMIDRGVPQDLVEDYMFADNITEPQYDKLRARLDQRTKEERDIAEANLIDVTRKNIRDAISDGQDFRSLETEDGVPYREIIGADNWDKYTTLFENREFEVRENYAEYKDLAEAVFSGDNISLDGIRQLREDIFQSMSDSSQKGIGLTRALGIEMLGHLDSRQTVLTKGLSNPVSSSPNIRQALQSIDLIYKVDDDMITKLEARSAIHRQRAVVKQNFVRQLTLWLAEKDEMPTEVQISEWVANTNGDNPTANINFIRQNAQESFKEFQGNTRLDLNAKNQSEQTLPELVPAFQANPPLVIQEFNAGRLSVDAMMFIQSKFNTNQMSILNNSLKQATEAGKYQPPLEGPR